MYILHKIAAWLRRYYDVCVFFPLIYFPILLHCYGLWVGGISLIFFNFIIYGFLFCIKFHLKIKFVPIKNKLVWFLMVFMNLIGFFGSLIWPNYVMIFLFFSLNSVFFVMIYEKLIRYKTFKERINRLRIKQLKWRNTKKITSSIWKNKLRWIAGIQHDMRQPLHALGLLIGHPALDMVSTESSVKLVLQQISSCQKWLQDLADNLLEVTRLELGEQRSIENGEIDSSELCGSIRNLISQLAEIKGLKLNINYKSYIICTDVRRLKRVIGNLVFNAVEHTHRGFVSLNYVNQNGKHCFVIEDSGNGLDLSFMQELSTTGVEIQSENNSDLGYLPKGGVGLFVVKKLCNEMRWKLSVVSSSESGTCFKLEFSDLKSEK